MNAKTNVLSEIIISAKSRPPIEKAGEYIITRTFFVSCGIKEGKQIFAKKKSMLSKAAESVECHSQHFWFCDLL